MASLRLALIVLLSTLASTALADTAETYARAVELVQQKKCDEALPLLREAHRATQSPNARLLIRPICTGIASAPWSPRGHASTR